MVRKGSAVWTGGVLFDGAVCAVGECGSDGGADRYGSGSDTRQSGRRLRDYPGTSHGDGKNSRSDTGGISKSYGSSEGRLPGFEVVQHEDHDGREAGVKKPVISG